MAAPFLKLDGSDWIFQKGKYEGETLESIAEEHPGYLSWMHDNVETLSDDEFYAIEDAMEKYDIQA